MLNTCVKILDSSAELTVDEFKQEIIGIYQELFLHANSMPGAVRLLKHLKKSNVPIASATSSDRENYELENQPLA